VITPSKKSDEFRQLLQDCRSYFATAAIFSLAINLLYLAGPLYMLQVYDRVISSASEITLLMLTIALLLAYLALAGLDAVRARVLTRTSIRLDQQMAPRVMTAIIDRSAVAGGRSQLLRDFDTFGNSSPAAAFTPSSICPGRLFISPSFSRYTRCSARSPWALLSRWC
jgi:ABC-type protease/lipase transport system fused ATPase/permease subunit